MALTQLTKTRARWATFKLKVTGAVTRLLYDVLIAKGVSVDDFGAVGDGVTNDTVAIKAALASSERAIYFTKGKEYIVDDDLVSTLDNRTLSGYGATLRSTTGNKLLTMTGNNNRLLGVELDGQDLAKVGVAMTGDEPEMKHCDVHNFRNDNGGANAVEISTLGRGLVKYNKLRNVFALSNGVLGDSIGASRAVYIGWVGADRSDYLDVEDNWIDNIGGEEGDAIHVQGTDITPYRVGKVRILRNVISRCTRRAVKLQADDNLVLDNVYNHELLEAASPNFAACVESLGSNNIIKRNKLDAISGIGVICNGISSLLKASGVEVADNFIMTDYNASADVGWDKSTQRAVYGNALIEPVIHNNNCFGGVTSIEVQDSNSPVVTDNMIHETENSKDSGNGIRIGSTCTSPVVSGNKGVSLDHMRTYFISMQAPDAVVTDNHSRYDSFVDTSHGVVNLSASALRAYVTGNTSRCDTFNAVSGTIDASSYVTGNKNLGAGLDGGSPTLRRVPVPASATAVGEEGDISFTSTHLYVCISTNTWVRTDLATWV